MFHVQSAEEVEILKFSGAGHPTPRNANNREKYRRRNPSVIPEIFIPRAETELGWNLISSPHSTPLPGRTDREERGSSAGL